VRFSEWQAPARHAPELDVSAVYLNRNVKRISCEDSMQGESSNPTSPASGPWLPLYNVGYNFQRFGLDSGAEAPTHVESTI
jgi:hypothetical protein